MNAYKFRKKSFAFLTFPSHGFHPWLWLLFFQFLHVSSSSFEAEVFARLSMLEAEARRSIVNYGASASWKRVLFTSDAEDVYPRCMRLKGCTVKVRWICKFYCLPPRLQPRCFFQSPLSWSSRSNWNIHGKLQKRCYVAGSMENLEGSRMTHFSRFILSIGYYVV